MIKKFIDPKISIIIVLAVFGVALFSIFGMQQVLDGQLTASLVKYREVVKPEEGRTLGSQIVLKAREQLETMVGSRCAEQSYDAFTAEWNEECQNQGLEEKCSLPREIAEPLINEYEQAESECYNR